MKAKLILLVVAMFLISLQGFAQVNKVHGGGSGEKTKAAIEQGPKRVPIVVKQSGTETAITSKDGNPRYFPSTLSDNTDKGDEIFKRRIEISSNAKTQYDSLRTAEKVSIQKMKPQETKSTVGGNKPEEQAPLDKRVYIKRRMVEPENTTEQKVETL